MNLGFKLGSRHIYTALSVGTAPRHVDFIAPSASLGGRLGDEGLHVDVDAGLTNHIFLPGGEVQAMVTHLRLNAGLAVRSRLTVYGGPSLNLLAQRQGEGEAVGPYFYDAFSADGATAPPWWVGFNAGLRY